MLFSEAYRSVTSNLSTSFAAVVTVLIGMFLVGLLIGFGSWARSWSEHKKGELLVEVFYCTEATCGTEVTPKQINTLQDRLLADPRVKDVDFVSKDEALRIMRKKEPELTRNLAFNPFPHAHKIIPKQGEDAQPISQSLSNPLPPGVEKVDDGKKTASRILEIANVINVIFTLAVLVLLAASVLLIANTIRLSIFARRREIEVMKLVGASNWFVRGPFVLEGLICGVLGALAAIALLILGKELALPPIMDRFDAGEGVQALPFALNALILIGIGLLVGAAGSGLTLRRFLRV